MPDEHRPSPTDTDTLTGVIEQRPPRAITGDWNWQTFGACRGMNVEHFFHPANERRRTKARRIDQAKIICASCPVIDACAQWALRTGEPYGIWGGLSEEERADRLGLRDLRYPAARRNP